MFSIFFIILYLQVFRVWWDGRSKMYNSQIVLLWYFRTFDNIQECFLLKGLTIRESCTFHFQRVERTQIRLMLVCTFESHAYNVLHLEFWVCDGVKCHISHLAVSDTFFGHFLQCTTLSLHEIFCGTDQNALWKIKLTPTVNILEWKCAHESDYSINRL